MKSIQINYFASGSDLELIADAIFAWSRSITIFAPRGHGNEIRGTLVVDKSQLIPKADGQIMFLAIDGYERTVHTDIVSLKKSAAQLGESDLWVFPEAARTKRTLLLWGGVAWNNPLLPVDGD